MKALALLPLPPDAIANSKLARRLKYGRCAPAPYSALAANRAALKERAQPANEWIATVPQADYNALVGELRAFGVRKRPSMRSSENNFAVGIRVPHSRRAALERAAAMRGLSVAGFVECVVGRALGDAGLIEQSGP